MLTTNLLPSEEKKLIQRETTQRIIRFFGFATVLIFTIGIILLMPSYIPLVFKKNTLERELVFEKEASQKLRIAESLAEIQKTNSHIALIRTASLTPTKASDILNQFFDRNGGIELKTITLQEGGNVLISGHAETRKNLLDFEKKLRDSNHFQQIFSPLSNIIRDTDILFTIRGTLKPQYQPY